MSDDSQDGFNDGMVWTFTTRIMGHLEYRTYILTPWKLFSATSGGNLNMLHFPA